MKTTLIQDFCRVIIFCVVQMLTLAAANAKTTADIYSAVSGSIVEIEGVTKRGLASGSGVVIDKETVLTNCHVIDGSYAITVGLGEDKYKAIPILGDKVLDLCILKVRNLKNPSVSITKNLPRIGEKVIAIGNPAGLERTISEGIISSYRRYKDSIDLIQITNPITFGSSGGGLFNQNGDLIGITSMALPRGNLNFAMPIKYVNFLSAVDGSKVPIKILENCKIQKLPLAPWLVPKGSRQEAVCFYE
jgi:serine protease Do